MKTLNQIEEPQKSYLVVKEPQNPKQARLSSIFPIGWGHPLRRLRCLTVFGHTSSLKGG
jgi:hypothetical protein